MRKPAPLLPAWLREELAPTPGRWRRALAMSGAGTLALAIALGLNSASFPAPLLGYKALLPSIVCTWRNLVGRLVAVAASAVAGVILAGTLVEVPWLMLPVFVLVVSALAYIAPVQQSPIRGYCAGLMMASTFYTVVLAPGALGGTAVILAIGFAVGLVVATAVAELRRTDRPHQLLGRMLAGDFTAARAHLRGIGERYRAAAGPAADGPGAMPSHLSTYLQALDLVRQERAAPELTRAFVALLTAAERIHLFASLADALSRQATARSYRRLLDDELSALLDAIDLGLGRFAQAAGRPHTVLSFEAAPTEAVPPWPDFPALVAALRSRQTAILTAGVIATTAVEESENLNGFIQALAGVAEVLHLPPEALEHVAPEARRRAPWIAPFDPQAAQFALKVGVASGIALVIGVFAQVRTLETVILTPLLLAQGSYGATLQKSGLRVLGVVVGGAVSALTVVMVMPNTDNVTVWLVVVFAVLLVCAYITLGTVRLSYFGLQTGITFLIVLVAEQPVVNIHDALWRFFGTVIGTLLLIAVFQTFPDYAGRQIVSLFGELLRTLLSIVPALDRPIPPVEQTQERGDRIITGLANILRLTGEARYEPRSSGIDPAAAVDAAGALRRIAHRWALIRRAHRVSRPPLPLPVRDAIAALERALDLHLRTLLAFVQARHHRARAGSSTHRAACAAAAAIAARPRPDLLEPLRALEDAVAEARPGVLRTWPTDAASALLAEVGHLRRLTELLPALRAGLERTCLPAAAAPAPEPTPIAHPVPAHGNV